MAIKWILNRASHAGLLSILFGVFWCGVLGAQESSPNGEELFTTAQNRIEQYRMGDVTLKVVDENNEAISGAKVEIRQKKHEFLFGSNIYAWGDQPTEELRNAYKDQYAALLNYATLAFYWPSYERERGQPRHASREEVARWCVEHDIARKGHPLAWNYADADWFPEDPETLLRLQLERIEDCVDHFRGLIDRWDVVNEVTHFDRRHFMERAPKLTKMWRETGKMEFTKQCFKEARRANPEATLLINDYRTGQGYVEVIEQLVDEQGEPLYDVIGIQSHMHGGASSNEKIWEVCERFARFGVPLHFTEMTIVSGEKEKQSDGEETWETDPEGEKYQAEHVARVYTILFSHPAVEAITWWDFSDFHAWQGAPAGLLRKDMTPKPAYRELTKLIKDRWWTELDETCDENGKTEFRAYAGEYEIKIFHEGEERFSRRLTIARGENVFDFQIDR
jgi:GH35 family endo-1,4-beta-xylanase